MSCILPLSHKSQNVCLPHWMLPRGELVSVFWLLRWYRQTPDGTFMLACVELASAMIAFTWL